MVIKKTQWQVEQFVNQELRGLPTYEVCEKLWHFVKNHIRYKKEHLQKHIRVELYLEDQEKEKRHIDEAKGPTPHICPRR